jgi:hypothetical protein
LILLSQDSTYSESTIYNDIKNKPFGNKNINKKYKKWLKNKTKNLKDLQFQIILKLGVIRSNDKEYAEIEEKVLISARLKLNNAKNIKFATQRDSYVKKLNLLIEQYESNFIR